MKNLILKLIRKIGFYFNIDICINKTTDNQKLKQFLKQLYPRMIDKPLIRVGSKTDGGYLIPDDLNEIEALFSPGVGTKQDFDHECAEKGIKIFMADASVDGPINNNKNFIFKKKFINSLDNETYISMEQWINDSKTNNKSDFILQMDIEGAEYEAITSIPNNIISRFRIIIIEFHQLDLLFSRLHFDRIKNPFLKILQTHYCVHIHPNNCCKIVTKEDISIPPVLEFTFIRKDRVTTNGYVQNFPNKLDVDCTNKEMLILPECWYKSN